MESVTRTHRRATSTTVPILVIALALATAALLPARTAAAQCGHPLAGWEAELEYSAPYGIDGVGVIVDAGTIRVDNFSYNGTGPDVYFYLGRSRSQSDLENGIAISGQLDRAYTDEMVELTVPPSVDLAEYRALSVWCRAFSVDFSSATFEPITPVAPTELVASAGCDDAVDLSWSHAGGAEEFLVERRSGGTWGMVAVVASDACGFADTGLTAGATYEYRVTASNDAGMSPPSEVASATNSPVFCDGFESGDTSSWSPTAMP